jgi:hypothetical protein
LATLLVHRQGRDPGKVSTSLPGVSGACWVITQLESGGIASDAGGGNSDLAPVTDIHSHRSRPDRLVARILKGPMYNRLQRAVLPRFEATGDQRLAGLNQVKRVREVKQLLQRQVRHRQPLLVGHIQRRVRDAPRIAG